jgi:CrcB protein
LIGVALAGYFLVLMERRGITPLRWFLLPGFCGGMTTFSAVTIEVVGEDALGFGYLALTVIASIVTIAVVIPFARATIKVKQ